MKWASLEPRPHELDHEEEPGSSSSPGVLDDQQLFLPGSGITKKLYSLRYSKLILLIVIIFRYNFYHSSSNNIKMVVLIVFCSQGDNIQDAVSLTRAPGSVDFSDTSLGMHYATPL